MQLVALKGATVQVRQLHQAAATVQPASRAVVTVQVREVTVVRRAPIAAVPAGLMAQVRPLHQAAVTDLAPAAK